VRPYDQALLKSGGLVEWRRARPRSE